MRRWTHSRRDFTSRTGIDAAALHRQLLGPPEKQVIERRQLAASSRNRPNLHVAEPDAFGAEFERTGADHDLGMRSYLSRDRQIADDGDVVGTIRPESLEANHAKWVRRRQRDSRLVFTFRRRYFTRATDIHSLARLALIATVIVSLFARRPLA